MIRIAIIKSFKLRKYKIYFLVFEKQLEPKINVVKNKLIITIKLSRRVGKKLFAYF